jgi:hemerythrin-like domain-containing protein
MIATLRAEHRHIARIMQLFSEQLELVSNGEMVDTQVIYEVMDYMVQWPDRFHHPREDLVYGRVAELDATAADNVDSLQREHDEMAIRGRQVLEAIIGWREGRVAGTEVVEQGRYYVQRMHEHMRSEEELVFPQIEAILSHDDWRELIQQDRLRPVRDPVFGPRIEREFRNLARKLRRGVRRAVERGAVAEWIGIEALMESVEVLSMAGESIRTITTEHLQAAWDNSLDAISRSPLTAPLSCSIGNTRQAINWAGELLGVTLDVREDLVRVNRERLDRLRLLDQRG